MVKHSKHLRKMKTFFDAIGGGWGWGVLLFINFVYLKRALIRLDFIFAAKYFALQCLQNIANFTIL